MSVKFEIPEGAAEIMRLLEKNGFDAYVVGGCVRDTLLNKTPIDWDITTSAVPNEILRIFDEYHKIPTGIRHGTVSICAQGQHFEVTTYRIDGTYSDNRRPDSVEFTKELKEDLRRRDFTINAMAYNHHHGLIDYFGGERDLQNHLIRCVGDAALRFSEDYLRIIRAYRFSSTLGFDLDADICHVSSQMSDKLMEIAPERVQQELVKLLVGDNLGSIRRFFQDCGRYIFPEIFCLIGFEQNNIFHCYDVFEHSIEALGYTKPVLVLRMAALLHDTGKFRSRTVDSNGIYHFHGHAGISAEISKEFLRKWRFSNDIGNHIHSIVKYHDISAPETHIKAKKFLQKFGIDLARDILAFAHADNLAKTDFARKKLDAVALGRELLEQAIDSGEPFHIKHLAISGDDIIESLKLEPSPKIGEILQELLNMVIERPHLNARERLIAEILRRHDVGD